MDERTLTERVAQIEQFLGSELGAAIKRDFAERVTSQRHVNEILSDRAADKLEGHLERAGNSTTQIVTSFEEIVCRIQGCTDRVLMIADAVEQIGVRVFGPLPETDELGAGVNKTNPEGTLDHTFVALNWLDRALGRLHSAAARIERI